MGVEQPEDPEEYFGEERRYASYWSWPEWKAHRDRWSLEEVSFDQGPMGHPRTKPTRFGTNILGVGQLQDCRGPGTGDWGWRRIGRES